MNKNENKQLSYLNLKKKKERNSRSLLWFGEVFGFVRGESAVPLMAKSSLTNAPLPDI